MILFEDELLEIADELEEAIDTAIDSISEQQNTYYPVTNSDDPLLFPKDDLPLLQIFPGLSKLPRLDEVDGFLISQDEPATEPDLSEAERIEVRVGEGRVAGYIVETSTGKQVARFPGLPYAEPPINRLRFKPPQQKRPWSGVWAGKQNVR